MANKKITEFTENTSRHFNDLLVMVDDPGSLHPEPEWFARSEPFACMGPAPFFSTEVLFQAGATLRFRYGVVVADGPSDQDRAEALATAARGILVAAPASPAGT